MARRKKSGSTGSLDSLLDTMTNVVGILVILLAVTQLGVGEAVQRISESLPDVSEAELALIEREAAELETQMSGLLKRQEELPPASQEDTVSLSEQRKMISRMKQDLADVSKAAVDVKQLRVDVEDRKKKVTDLEKKIKEADTQIATLKAKLDTTPELGPAPPAKVVNLPNPRSAPEGTKPIVLICREGKIAVVNQPKLEGIAQTVLRKMQKRGETETVDCSKLVEYFDTHSIDDGYIRLKAKVINGVPQLVINFTERGGETVEKIERRSSVFQGMLRKIDPQKYYLRFLVWSDSFDVYLVARQLAAERDVMAGWIPYDKGWEYRIRFDVPVTCSDQPPPPPKPATPTPPGQKPTKPVPVDDID